MPRYAESSRCQAFTFVDGQEAGPDVTGSDGKYRAVQLLQRFVINPPVRLAWQVGLAPPGDAQLETIGRHSGRPHRTPICNGLEGATFWLIAQTRPSKRLRPKHRSQSPRSHPRRISRQLANRDGARSREHRPERAAARAESARLLA